MTVPTKSKLMRFAESFGMERLAWSLRRLYCPVSADALVLDVGSGGNPYPRANVLLDAYEETVERYNLPLIKDRPIVFGLAERMPFRSKVFDFVIASHVLEHTADPDAFISELMRVGKAGYIETPDGFFERINPFRFHRLEVFDKDNQLVIIKKPAWKPYPELVEMYERKMKDSRFLRFLSQHPGPFYVRYYWEDRIDYRVLNPEVDANWPLPIVQEGSYKDQHGKIRLFLLQLVRGLFSQKSRNKKIDLLALLRCPACASDELRKINEGIQCECCGAVYAQHDHAFVLYPK